MAEDLRQASLNAKNAMDLAERALSVLFDEVDGAPLKRYDFSDGTNSKQPMGQIKTVSDAD